MATQVQARGAAQATQEARTLVSRELDVNTTDVRLSIHDGSTAGGIPHVNYKDQQNNEYSFAAGAGTNTITISVAKAPAAYQAGQSFTFSAANTITGSATLNVNSLGALTLKKKNVDGGSLDTLAAGDIIQAGIYTAHVLDSSNALIEATDAGGLSSVSQGDLNTSTGAVSTTNDTNGENLTLPGGTYGFYPQVKTSSTADEFESKIRGALATGNTTYTTLIWLKPSDSIYTASAQQRYITSSPPFDLGDGEAGGFIFLLMNADGSVAASYVADVPPWAYNGPTNIRADRVNRRTGVKYRRVLRPMTIEQIMDGDQPGYEWQEITQAVKNADMGLIPHPFGSVSPGQTVALLDPMDSRLARLLEYQNAGGGEEILAAVHRGLIRPDNEPLTRRGPAGVMQVKFNI